MAFSLLEVIIATAILAASAMVLTSLLGLGTKYGNRAEERSLVASQAQSLIDETIATAASRQTTASDQKEFSERVGTLPGRPPHGYRLTIVPFNATSSQSSSLATAPVQSVVPLGTASGQREPTATPPRGLVLISVQVFASEQPASDAVPMLELSQLVRRSQLWAPSDPSNSTTSFLD